MDLQVARDLFTVQFGESIEDADFDALWEKKHPLHDMVVTLGDAGQFMWVDKPTLVRKLIPAPDGATTKE